ncbi:MAG: DUF932 domain-containing protein [Candidatus Methanoplasma sp.]|nr:DUF932 domain-containing protein [Candidatus Methanoplasma sp.]
MTDLEQIYRLAGVRPPANAYRPPSVGRLGKMRTASNTFVGNLRDVTFKDPTQLRAQAPEHVKWVNPVVPFKTSSGDLNYSPSEDYRAIVGERSNKVYSIMSNKYNPVQHSKILEAMAQASEQTGINVFGSVSEAVGTMHAHGFFMSPEVKIEEYADRVMRDDPFMLGVRMYNSHNGKTGFGAEVFGIRMVCFNYNAFGFSLGKIGWKHNVKKDNIIDGFGNVMGKALDQVPNLADHLAKMNLEAIDIDEATALLYGISLSPTQADTIVENIEALNPDVKDKKKLKVYDLYNAATAYTSHRPGSERLDGSIDISHKIEKLMLEDTDILYAKGVRIIEKIEEQKRIKELKVTKKNTNVSMPEGW